jgi:hypothetical protein
MFRQISFQLSGKNGATGMSDMAGKAARPAVERSGRLPRYKADQPLNSSHSSLITNHQLFSPITDH